ncbi:MAG: hypothetical protein AB1726_00020 [Planctomycetota bacterium]
MADDAFAELTFRPYAPGDETAILASFNRVFAAVDPNFRPRGLAHWRWQYLENPSGSPIYLALAPGGEVVGHMGGVCQRMATEFGPTLFMQGVDHFSDPSRLHGLRRGSLLAAVGERQAELVGGDGPDRVALMWGPPVPAAWRVGKSFLSYELIRTQLKLWAAPDAVRASAAGGVEVSEAASFPDEVAELFARAAAPHGAIAVRDRAQLDWRYRKRPGRRYAIVLARRAGRLAGYAVYARAPFDGEAEESLLVDWLVPPEEDSAAHALRAWLAARAKAEGAERVVAVFPDTTREWMDFQAAGFRAAPTRHFIIAKIEVKRFRARWLFRRWYYTLGDTDLV